MNRNKGFTLAELLVYVAIFAIVAGLLTTIFFLIVNSQKKTSVSSEVNQQLNFVLTTVQRLVGESSLVEAVYEGDNPSSSCATFCTLKLRRSDLTKDPTIVSSNATGIFLQEGSSTQVALTTNKVLINYLRFVKHEIPGGHSVAEISTSFNYNTNNPAFAVTKAIESAIARVNAATFDADLLPNQDNTFDIGQTAGSNLRWKNGRFSGDLTVGGQLQISGGSPGAGKILTSDAGGLGSWQTPSAVPTGAVMFFNLSSCPSGWTDYSSAQGRYLVGKLPGGTLGATVGTAFTVDQENRPVGQHAHSITDLGHIHSVDTWSPGTGADRGNNLTNQAQRPINTASAVTGISVNATGTTVGTNAPYIQLLACQKS